MYLCHGLGNNLCWCLFSYNIQVYFFKLGQTFIKWRIQVKGNALFLWGKQSGPCASQPPFSFTEVLQYCKRKCSKSKENSPLWICTFADIMHSFFFKLCTFIHNKHRACLTAGEVGGVVGVGQEQVVGLGHPEVHHLGCVLESPHRILVHHILQTHVVHLWQTGKHHSSVVCNMDDQTTQKS